MHATAHAKVKFRYLLLREFKLLRSREYPPSASDGRDPEPDAFNELSISIDSCSISLSYCNVSVGTRIWERKIRNRLFVEADNIMDAPELSASSCARAARELADLQASIEVDADWSAVEQTAQSLADGLRIRNNSCKSRIIFNSYQLRTEYMHYS